MWTLDIFQELNEPLTLTHSSPPPSTISSKEYGYEYPEQLFMRTVFSDCFSLSTAKVNVTLSDDPICAILHVQMPDNFIKNLPLPSSNRFNSVLSLELDPVIPLIQCNLNTPLVYNISICFSRLSTSALKLLTCIVLIFSFLITQPSVIYYEKAGRKSNSTINLITKLSTPSLNNCSSSPTLLYIITSQVLFGFTLESSNHSIFLDSDQLHIFVDEVLARREVLCRNRKHVVRFEVHAQFVIFQLKFLIHFERILNIIKEQNFTTMNDIINLCGLVLESCILICYCIFFEFQIMKNLMDNFVCCRQSQSFRFRLKQFCYFCIPYSSSGLLFQLFLSWLVCCPCLSRCPCLFLELLYRCFYFWMLRLFFSYSKVFIVVQGYLSEHDFISYAFYFQPYIGFKERQSTNFQARTFFDILAKIFFERYCFRQYSKLSLSKSQGDCHSSLTNLQQKIVFVIQVFLLTLPSIAASSIVLVISEAALEVRDPPLLLKWLRILTIRFIINQTAVIMGEIQNQTAILTFLRLLTNN